MNGYRPGAVALVLLAVVILPAGCRKPPLPLPPLVEAGGEVRLEDKPLKRVKVRFVPSGDFAGECDAVGVTDDEGKFTLTCRGQPGASLGENVVIVEESEVPAELRGEKSRLDKIKYFQGLEGRPLPRKYTSLSTSPLVVTVTADRKKYTIALTREQETKSP